MSKGRGEEIFSKTFRKENEDTRLRPKVLVVDDDLLIVTKLTDLLVANGYRVVTARDGKAGLAQVQAEKPDLVILDIAMPEMDGYEVAYQLRQDPALRRIPIIVLTAKTGPDVREKTLRSGADTYMIKPVNNPLLLAQIRSLLVGRGPQSS
ncbi:MAG: PleD family two-component system response regulator [Candidatus Methylomirabilales bacterium]